MFLRKFRVRRTVAHLKRYRHIVGVLMKYSLDELAGNLRQRLRIRFGAGAIPTRITRAPNGRSRPQRLRLALEELGPTFIKLGQLLSTRPDLLGPNYICELEKLQDRVPPFAGEDARRLVEAAIGRPVEAAFSAFEAEPLASASVAQVHAATLIDGSRVVVKVVRPGIEAVIAEDLDLLKMVAGFLERYFPDARRLHPLHMRPDQIASYIACTWSITSSSSVTSPSSKLRRPSPFAPSPAPVQFALPT